MSELIHDEFSKRSGITTYALGSDASLGSVPSIKTIISILDSLVMCGNLRRTYLHRRSSISYMKLKEYIDWLKNKNLVVEIGSSIGISEKGRMLYAILTT